MQSTTMRAGFEALGIEYYARWYVTLGCKVLSELFRMLYILDLRH